MLRVFKQFGAIFTKVPFEFQKSLHPSLHSIPPYPPCSHNHNCRRYAVQYSVYAHHGDGQMTSLTLSTISTITFNTRNAAWLFSHRRPSYLRVPTSISNPLLDLPIMWTGKFLFFLLDVDQMLRQFAHKRATSNDEKIHRNKKC